MSDSLNYNTAPTQVLLSDPYVKQLIELALKNPTWDDQLLVGQLTINRGKKKKLTTQDARIILKRLQLQTKSQRQTYAFFNQHVQDISELQTTDYEIADMATVLSDKHTQSLLEIVYSYPELSSLQMVDKLPRNIKGAPVLTYAQVKTILRRMRMSTVEDRLRKIADREEHTVKQELRQVIPYMLTSLTQYNEYKQMERNQAKQQSATTSPPPSEPVTPREVPISLPSTTIGAPSALPPQPSPLPAFSFTPAQQSTFKTFDRFFFLTRQLSFVIVSALVFLLSGSLILDYLFRVQGVLQKIGMFFSFSAFVFGIFFLLYSLKYYMTIGILLTFSRDSREEPQRKGVIPFFERLFGVTTETEKSVAKQPAAAAISLPTSLSIDLSTVTLPRHPFVSVHVATYNEKRVVDRFLLAATSIDYDNYEIIVADDSTDETVQLLEQWRNHPRVKISHRDTREGYKGAALKKALTLTDPRTEYVLVFDADFIPYPDSIIQFLKYFQATCGSLSPTGSPIAAVQGYQWHILNKSENWVTRGVRTEYSGSYVIERSGAEIYGGLKQISGSVYMIRADVLKELKWGTSITEVVI